MALKRSDIIFAGAGGFIAWGFLVSWYPIIRLIGYAFVFGAISAVFCLTAIFSIVVRRTGNDSRTHPVDLCGTSIAFLSPGGWNKDLSNYRQNAKYEPSPLYPQSFIVSAALDELFQLVMGEFISSWYGNISKSPKFVNEVDRGIRTVVDHLKERLLEEDLVEILVSRIIPIVTNHLKDFDQAEKIIRGRNLSRSVTESEELDIAIATRYREGKLHPAASASHPDNNHAQQDHLRKIVVTLLPQLLPPNMVGSRAVSVLIREIVTCGVLFPVMEILADPDTWNQLMEVYGRTALQDRKTVRKLRAALDQHASPSSKSKRGNAFPRLGPNDSERDFERFVRAIRRCNFLSDARRFRNHVASQLKRESMFEEQDQVYLRRLETGKRVLDQKVARLSALNGRGNRPAQATDLRSSYVSKSHEVSLVDVMHNAVGLSYFMEYMDRLHLMSLVQFWVVVDGFRNPLEDDFGDDTPSSAITWTAADRNDMILISENHLSNPELKVPDESRKIVKDFINAGKRASADQYRKARTVILTTQSAILEEMQRKYYSAFKQSDLYYKYLASDEAATAAASSTPSPIPQLDRPALDRSPVSENHDPRPSPPIIRRTASQSSYKSRDLRRAAMSATDISNTPHSGDTSQAGRRSVDLGRPALFSDDLEIDPLEASTASLGRDSQNGDSDIHTNHVIENMEAALNDILTDAPSDARAEGTKSSLGSPTSLFPPGRSNNNSARSSLDIPRIDGHPSEKGKPSILSLGLVNTSSRIGVFTDDDLFPDQKKFIEDEYADPAVPDNGQSAEEEIHEAAPGDLGLAEAISALKIDIEKLVSQEAVVDTLTRKAELTNNTAELRILGKSKASIQRELRRKEMQRQQYVVQESDNSLYGRSTVQIKSTMVDKEADGHEYALYLIEVKRNAGEQMPAASWAVPRRYSEFHELHQRLRAGYPSVRNLEFPRRRMVMKLQKDFLHKRRIALEVYLQQLLLLPEVCRSRDLRSFLSQRAIIPSKDEPRDGSGESKDIVTRIYNSVADGMDDFLGNIAVLDQLSTAGQNLISAATNQLNTSQQDLAPEDSITAAEAEAELNAFEDRELEPFVKPICDIFLEIFELNKGNNWLRGRAVVVVLHQLLGGTIERKVRENAKSLIQDASLLRYISLIKDTMWPNGKLRERKPRALSEKMQSRTEASVMLATLIPDLATSVVGRANAQAAARRIFASSNNHRLNLHLVYTILDEAVMVLFGK